MGHICNNRHACSPLDWCGVCVRANKRCVYTESMLAGVQAYKDGVDIISLWVAQSRGLHAHCRLLPISHCLSDALVRPGHTIPDTISCSLLVVLCSSASSDVGYPDKGLGADIALVAANLQRLGIVFVAAAGNEGPAGMCV